MLHKLGMRNKHLNKQMADLVVDSNWKHNLLMFKLFLQNE